MQNFTIGTRASNRLRERIHQTVLVVLAVLSVLMILSASGVTAQDISDGCNILNSIDGLYISSTIGGITIYQGERITASAGPPSAGTPLPTVITLTFDGAVVATSPYPGTVAYTVPATAIAEVGFSVDAVSGATWDVECIPAGSSSGTTSGGPGPLASNLLDGRINNDQGRDVAAPVAIYTGSIEVYGIDPLSSVGVPSLRITDAMIDAAGVPENTPVLLGESTNAFTGIPIYVYRLPTGEFQLNTHYVDGKAYVFVWDEDGNSYHLPQ